MDHASQEDETTTRIPSLYEPLDSFRLPTGDAKQYQQQYGDLYFLRLARLKPAVEAHAHEAWDDLEIGGEKVRHVDRVLDVRQGELCWVAGTIYMEMPLKPNILDDISKDHWIAAPPPREKYISPDGLDQIMLEDESGRLRLVGAALQIHMLVTGCIVAVMGTENAGGDFEIVDVKVPDLAPQPDLVSPPSKGKIAIVSGLGIAGEEGDFLRLDLLLETLTGELGGPHSKSTAISRLIIAGNSVAEGNPLRSEDGLADTKKVSKKYGYDSSAYNPLPTTHLDEFLATLLSTIPITIMPGETDPSNVALPQQPIHPAMFPRSRTYAAAPNAEQPGWFDSVTNPWEANVDGCRLMGNSGQPIDDVYKYVEGEDRLEMMENLMRWRCTAPTAPDTLWCYPFQEKDQFVIEQSPHVYFVGNQPAFETAVIQDEAGQSVRLIALPKFKQTGEVVLLDTNTLEVELLRLDIVNDL